VPPVRRSWDAHRPLSPLRPPQLIRKLAEGEKLLAESKTIEEVSRHLEISEQTWHRWRNQYGLMKADDAKRLKELAEGNF